MSTFEAPSDCKNNGYDIACSNHVDDKPLREPGIIREKVFVNGCFAGYITHQVGERVTEEQAKRLPVGTRVTFNRWAGACYQTKYYRVATYAVVPRKRGGGNYLKLISGYSRRGGKYEPEWEGRILEG